MAFQPNYFSDQSAQDNPFQAMEERNKKLDEAKEAGASNGPAPIGSYESPFADVIPSPAPETPQRSYGDVYNDTVKREQDKAAKGPEWLQGYTASDEFRALPTKNWEPEKDNWKVMEANGMKAASPGFRPPEGNTEWMTESDPQKAQKILEDRAAGKPEEEGGFWKGVSDRWDFSKMSSWEHPFGPPKEAPAAQKSQQPSTGTKVAGAVGAMIGGEEKPKPDLISRVDTIIQQKPPTVEVPKPVGFTPTGSTVIITTSDGKQIELPANDPSVIRAMGQQKR